jgi:3-oxoacyl-[acyl-carrier protein] reductase
MSGHVGKVALVTGADRGIGYAISRRLWTEGARLILHSNNEDGLMRNAAAEDQGRERDVLRTVLDIRDRPSIERAVGRAVERFGRIDYLVNVAGINVFGGIERCTEDEWDEVLDVNLKGYFLMARAVYPHMIAGGGGSIVNVSSIWGHRGNPKMMAYAVSKHGVEGFTRSLAEEARLHGIKVTSLVVDKVDSAFRERMTGLMDFTEEQKARMLQPEDVADACLYALESSARALPSSIQLDAWLWR